MATKAKRRTATANRKARSRRQAELIKESQDPISYTENDPIFQAITRLVAQASSLTGTPAAVTNGGTPAAPNPAVNPSPQEADTCLFIHNCDTEAPLRKSVSHFFGRNKTCTRQIPQELWVHYCRKHYQRVKYRNMVGYSLIQINLVRLQILRLKHWSLNGGRTEDGCHLKDYTISLQKRLRDHLEGKPGKEPKPAPKWVVDSKGHGFPAEHLLGFLNRLESELKGGAFEELPNFEFLPNFVKQGQDESSGASRTRRRASAQAESNQPTPAIDSSGAPQPGSEGNANTSADMATRARIDLLQGSHSGWDPAQVPLPRTREQTSFGVTPQPMRQTVPNANTASQLPTGMVSSMHPSPMAMQGWMPTQARNMARLDGRLPPILDSSNLGGYFRQPDL